MISGRKWKQAFASIVAAANDTMQTIVFCPRFFFIPRKIIPIREASEITITLTKAAIQFSIV